LPGCATLRACKQVSVNAPRGDGQDLSPHHARDADSVCAAEAVASSDDALCADGEHGGACLRLGPDGPSRCVVYSDGEAVHI
jgi:hypothetical protein